MSQPSAPKQLRSPAEIYETMFVPALFAGWTDWVLDATTAGEGAAVVDVACGTGVLARAARERSGPVAVVAGVDPDERMLGVARDIAPDIDWRCATADAIPFPDNHFDHCVSQFGMMFFPDPGRALAEMARVTRPAGGVAVAVWGSLEDCPAFGALADILEAQFGPEVAAGLRSPFSMGDTDALRGFVGDASLTEVEVTTRAADAVFDDMAAWMIAEAYGWLALQRPFSEADFERLMQGAERGLTEYVAADGTVRLPMKAHVLSGRVAGS